jgi:2-keto-4-pentenoate hydratase/2-oxohepta-3-ene-1,7-dioic acid hydratase in catechol pathway
MKLMRYNHKRERTEQARLGVLVGHELVADLRAAYARYLIEEIGNPKGRELAALFLPPYIAQFLHVGAAAWEALSETYGWLSDLVKSEPDALGLNGEQLFIPLAECRLHAPVRGSKLIAVGRNYPGQVKTDGKHGAKVPSAFIKVPSCVVGPGRDILKPAATRQLDCEAELAIVIGKKCKHVPEDKVHDVIAGYTILNDITARDISALERQGGNPMLGKTFDTFAPMGPWLVTKVEIHDPMQLRLRTLVNGEVRQEGSTRDMTYSIAKLVSYLSQMTLMPGDVISTGSPDGGGLVRPAWFLNAGDVIECEIEKIGTLVNAVVDEPKS